MTLQGFNSRRLQGLYRNLQAFGIGTIPARTLVSITISTDEKIFISDNLNKKVLVYHLDGTKIDEWGTQGTASGQFNNIGRIVWYNSEIYAFTALPYRVQVFSESGVWDRTINETSSLGDAYVAFDIYDDLIYAIQAPIGITPNDTVTKLNLEGTIVSNFDITNATIWDINHETSQLYVVTTIPSQVYYQLDDDGTQVAAFNNNDYSSAEKLGWPSITVGNTYLYTNDGTRKISKHGSGGSFFDSNTTSASPSKSWPQIKYFDGHLYAITNYSDTSINSKVQVYRADTLDFDSEWTAT